MLDDANGCLSGSRRPVGQSADALAAAGAALTFVADVAEEVTATAVPVAMAVEVAAVVVVVAAVNAAVADGAADVAAEVPVSDSWDVVVATAAGVEVRETAPPNAVDSPSPPPQPAARAVIAAREMREGTRKIDVVMLQRPHNSAPKKVRAPSTRLDRSQSRSSSGKRSSQHVTSAGQWTAGGSPQ